MKKNLIIKVVIIAVVVILAIPAGLLAWRLYLNKDNFKKIQVYYLCQGDKTIKASYQDGQPVAQPPAGEAPIPTGSVTLVLSDGRELNLPRTISGSGIRYANSDESIVFWSKGDGAFLTENNTETYSGCTEVK